jgi:tetratricopeptide (TPR) repeat protein
MVSNLNATHAAETLEKAKAAQIQGNLEEALDYCHQTIEHDASFFWAYHLMGKIYEQQEKLELAIICYQNSIALDLNNTKNFASYYRLGLVYVKQDKLEDAIAAHEKALQINSNFTDSYHELAAIFVKQGHLDLAIELQQKAKDLKPDDIYVNFAWINFQERKKNLAELANFKYKIISLGFDCLPRTIATRWGIKPSRSQGELSCPFDLAFHSYSNICKLLDNDFDDYLNPQYLELVRHKNNSNQTIVINTKYLCKFVHENGFIWQENDFQKFRKRYEQRINNFYGYLKENPILFILNLNINSYDIYPQKLVDIIDRKFPDLNFKLLVIDTSPKGQKSKPKENNSTDSHILIESIPLPSTNYHWSLNNHYATEAGILFERKIALAMRSAIEQFLF